MPNLQFNMMTQNYTQDMYNQILHAHTQQQHQQQQLLHQQQLQQQTVQQQTVQQQTVQPQTVQPQTVNKQVAVNNSNLIDQSIQVIKRCKNIICANDICPDGKPRRRVGNKCCSCETGRQTANHKLLPQRNAIGSKKPLSVAQARKLDHVRNTKNKTLTPAKGVAVKSGALNHDNKLFPNLWNKLTDRNKVLHNKQAASGGQNRPFQKMFYNLKNYGSGCKSCGGTA